MNTKQTAHTPTPWVVSSDGRSIEAIDKTSNLPLTTICTFPSPAFPQDAGNAAFIVRACNSFDDLVAALRDMTRIARAASMGVSGNQPRIAKAEAALSKAGAA